jgi:hypothetical protein
MGPDDNYLDMPLAETSAGGAVRVCTVDGGRAPETQPVHGVAGRQEGEGCETGRMSLLDHRENLFCERGDTFAGFSGHPIGKSG